MDYDDRPWLAAYDPDVAAESNFPDCSMNEVFRGIARDLPGQPALHFFGVTLTYQELMDHANRFAQALIDCGCTRGDVVGINLPNIPQYLIAHIGALKAGCAASGVSPLLTGPELAYQLKDSGAKALVTLDAIFEARITGIADQLPDLKLVVATGLADFLPWIKRTLAKWLKKVPTGKVTDLPGKVVKDFMGILATYAPRDPDIVVTPDDACHIMYTGGTTGVPKGTVMSHRNMVAELTIVAPHWLKLARGREVILSGFPFFHIAGLALGLGSIMVGAVQILVPNPRDTKHIVKEMATYRPTVLVNVPSLYMMLMEEAGFKKLDFSRLRFCLSAASPFPAEYITALESITGPGTLVEAYGMTEVSSLATSNPVDGRKKIGSIGLPLPNTRIKLVDLMTGTQEVPVGEEGEIIVSGPQVMQGYLNKPEETALALREHEGELWLHTGDVARMDEDGFFTLVDRTKDMLNVGGFKVFSREVEDKFYQHPAVELCAIVGTPNEKRPGTHVVKLVVQASRAHADKNENELRDDLLVFARENLAPYKVPKVVEFLHEMPLTAVGKVDKKALR
jgi:long-chain acyl-CoA synthetase